MGLKTIEDLLVLIKIHGVFVDEISCNLKSDLVFDFIFHLDDNFFSVFGFQEVLKPGAFFHQFVAAMFVILECSICKIDFSSFFHQHIVILDHCAKARFQLLYPLDNINEVQSLFYSLVPFKIHNFSIV